MSGPAGQHETADIYDGPAFYDLPGFSRADDLDVADNWGVFFKRNYGVAKGWEHVAELGLSFFSPEQTDELLIEAFGTERTVPQRNFVRRVIRVLKSKLDAKQARALEDLSFEKGVPRSCGIVALAVQMKENAKMKLLSIKGEDEHVTVSRLI